MFFEEQKRDLHTGIAQDFNKSWTGGQVLSFRFNMAEEDRATASSIKIPTWDGTEGEKAQTHVWPNSSQQQSSAVMPKR